MESPPGDPYASPAVDEPTGPLPARDRPPLGRLMMGVPAAAASAVVAFCGVYPLGSALEYWAFGYWDFPPAWLEVLVGVLVIGALAAIATSAGALLVYAARWRPLTALGAAAGALTLAWLLWAVYLFWLSSQLIGRAGMFMDWRNLVFLLTIPVLALGVPLIAAASAFAFWLHRVARRQTAPPAPSGDGRATR